MTEEKKKQLAEEFLKSTEGFTDHDIMLALDVFSETVVRPRDGMRLFLSCHDTTSEKDMSLVTCIGSMAELTASIHLMATSITRGNYKNYRRLIRIVNKQSKDEGFKKILFSSYKKTKKQ